MPRSRSHGAPVPRLAVSWLVAAALVWAGPCFIAACGGGGGGTLDTVTGDEDADGGSALEDTSAPTGGSDALVGEVGGGTDPTDGGPTDEVADPAVELDPSWSRCDFAPSFYCTLVRSDGDLVAVSVDYVDEVLEAYESAGIAATACGDDDCDEAMAHCLHDQCKVGDNCLDMDADACAFSPSCRPVLALEAATLCLTDDYEPAYDDGVTKVVGCVPVADDYGGAPLCVAEDATGEVAAVFEQYTPLGWTITDEAACCAPLNTWCQTLDEASCAQEPLKCQPVMAAPGKGVCAEDPERVEGFAVTWIGCFGNAVAASWSAPVCSQDIISGALSASPPGMTPPSHQVVDDNLCCSGWDGCVLGDAVAPASVCVRGFEDGDSWVFSDFSYLNIVVSAGDCTATSCPEVIEAPCTKGVSGEDITLDATLCVVPGGPDACPAGSCKAPLLGECGTHDVYDADWTVSVGSLTVALTVPSTVPAGSTCAEPTD